ncbi:MAG: response regulator transcription factor [Lachnospiraceae bacterium]
MTDILIVEDNKELAEVLGDFLRAEGYIVSTALSAEHAVSMFERYGAKLVILDIMLPGADGFEALRRIRENDNTPVIIVSAKTEKDDKLNGLMLGADDYIEKPYDIDILMAKVRGIFKRRYQTDSIVCGDLTLDRIKCTAKKKDRLLNLNTKEFALLLYLVENKGRAVSKDTLFNKIWGFDSESEQQTLTVHIKWLREKLEDNPKQPKHIITVWGVGYRYEE